MKMARPAPGSLAARSDLRNRLTFFKRRQTARGDRASSVGEVTIEIEDANDGPEDRPAKASPLVDCESGPVSASPTLTISPTSSPVQAFSVSSQSPRTNQSSQPSPPFQPKPSAHSSPFPASEHLVTLAPHLRDDSGCSTPPEVVLRRKQRAEQQPRVVSPVTSSGPSSAPSSWLLVPKSPRLPAVRLQILLNLLLQSCPCWRVYTPRFAQQLINIFCYPSRAMRIDAPGSLHGNSPHHSCSENSDADHLLSSHNPSSDNLQG